MQDSSKLWLFSLAFYKKPEVKAACLLLQNKYHADVNLLLFLLYQSSLQQQLSQKSILAIDEEIRPFRVDVIHAIRTVRQSLKGKEYSDALYKNVLSLELDAEKLEQSHLSIIKFESSNNLDAMDAAEKNLFAYTQMLGISGANKAVNTLLSQFENWLLV